MSETPKEKLSGDLCEVDNHLIDASETLLDLLDGGTLDAGQHAVIYAMLSHLEAARKELNNLPKPSTVTRVAR